MWLRCGGLGCRELSARGLRRRLRGPLRILVEAILGVALRGLLNIFRNLIFSVRIVRIFCFDIGERIKRTRTRLLGTELLGELIVIGVGGQVLELSGYFLLFDFLTSAAHLTP